MTTIEATTRLESGPTLRFAWEAERSNARAASVAGDREAEWRHLERAHILSQPMVWTHVVTHADMLKAAWRRRARREIAGQLIRLLLAGPASLTGRYPVGNTGGADVSAFRAMPVPDDIRSLLDREGVR